MKTGIIDVGGGLRGIYASGIFDYCLDQDIQFDLCIGVSAGSANIASYLAGQKKRNYLFYTDYAFRKEYMSALNFLKNGSYIDLDYIYGTLSDSHGENPLDYKKLKNNHSEMIVVASNALTGQVKYFNKNDITMDNYNIFKASSAIPFVCKPYEVNGELYFDGALGDPVPINKAFELGCDKVVVILTKPKDIERNSKKDKMLAKGIQRKYPLATTNLLLRAQRYNQGVALAKQYENQEKVLIIAPDDTCGIDTLTKNKDALKQLYEKGYNDAKLIKKFLKNCSDYPLDAKDSIRIY